MDWSKARGIQTIDYNNSLLLARTPVEQLAAALAPKAASWQRDVLGKTVPTDGNYGWAFQLEGHAWSIFLHDMMSGTIITGEELAKTLRVPTIDYGRGDTSGTLWYAYYEKGAKLEELSVDGDEVHFSSKRRKLKVTSANAALELADDFFRSVDACEPGIGFDYFFSDGRTRIKPGAKAKVGNPGFVTHLLSGGEEVSRPTFVRIDHLVFKVPKRRSPFE
jgi:hypothetical protein